MTRLRCGFLALATIGSTLVVQAPAMAGETITFHSKHINVAKTFDTQELEDEDGHIIAKFHAQGVGVRIDGPAEPPYKIEIWGTGDYKGDGTGKDQGYGKFIFSDGSSYFERWSGTVADGKATGTAVYYNGTGRFVGLEGGSKYECTLLGDRFACNVDGTIKLP